MTKNLTQIQDCYIVYNTVIQKYKSIVHFQTSYLVFFFFSFLKFIFISWRQLSTVFIVKKKNNSLNLVFPADKPEHRWTPKILFLCTALSLLNLILLMLEFGSFIVSDSINRDFSYQVFVADTKYCGGSNARD